MLSYQEEVLNDKPEKKEETVPSKPEKKPRIEVSYFYINYLTDYYIFTSFK